MSCFRPNASLLNPDDYSGRTAVFLGRFQPQWLGSDSIVPIPCGKCRGCRLDKGRKWADRMLLEYSMNKKALFLTLTYNEHCLPDIKCSDGVYRPTLRQRDMQLYNKRLRRYFDDLTLRNFYCGEYGEKTFRPHYHEIIFGLDDTMVDSIPYSTSESGEQLYFSWTLNRLWEDENGNNRGLVLHSPASYSTFSYVARYCLKKQFGSDSDKFYLGRKKPFCQASTHPALGTSFFVEHGIEFSRYSLSDGVNVHDIEVPRVIMDKLKLTDPELYANIKENKQIFASSRQSLILDQTDDDYFSYLAKQESEFVRRTQILNRKDVSL